MQLEIQFPEPQVETSYIPTGLTEEEFLQMEDEYNYGPLNLTEDEKD